MSEPIVWLTIFVLSVFVGIEVIFEGLVHPAHPLMSGANAIHGIILLGAVLVTGTTDKSALVVGLVAIVLAAVNMVGGFVVTDRMLQMFVRKKLKVAAGSTDGKDAAGVPRDTADLGPAGLSGLRGLLHPRAQGPVGARPPASATWSARPAPSSRWRSRSSTSTWTTSR